MGSLTFEIPFITIGNRQCLTGIQMTEEPAIADFVNRFSKCFARSFRQDVVWFYPDGDAPEFETDLEQ